MTSKTPPKTLPEAFVAAQAEMQNAALNKTNPHYKSRYADMVSVREATLPVLAKYGLAIVQTVTTDEDGHHLVSKLVHAGGEMWSSRYPLPDLRGDPQKMAAAITYARRISWAALCGIAAEEDDDGNAASTPPAKKSAPAKNPPKTELSAAAEKATTEAKRLRNLIDKVGTIKALDTLLSTEEATLEEIKGHSQVAYDFLSNRAEAKRAMLAQAPA